MFIDNIHNILLQRRILKKRALAQSVQHTKVITGQLVGMGAQTSFKFI